MINANFAETTFIRILDSQPKPKRKEKCGKGRDDKPLLNKNIIGN